MQHAIACYNVSTERQRRSGLSIEAEREAVPRCAAAEGFAIVSEFVEVETGKSADSLDRRPQFPQRLSIFRFRRAGQFMLRKSTRFTTVVLIFAWISQIAGLTSVFAEPRVVNRDDGLTLFEDVVDRADGGTGTILVARIEPDKMRLRVIAGNEPPPDNTSWSVTINGSFFDERGTPIYHLREGDRVLAPFRKGTSAVFWCRNGRCAIQHSSKFVAEQTFDLAVQSSPRLMDQGKPTNGVRGADVVDGRAGLAIATDGAVLVFATPPLSWGGMSFNGVRDLLTESFQSESILMLDGGNSARLTVQIGELTYGNGPFSREVPYSIRFIGP